MKVGVVADIHANRPALQAVRQALAAYDVDALVCLGDIVGVLGSAQYCAATIRDEAAHVVYGNHDARVFPDRTWLPTRDTDVVEYEHVTGDVTPATFDWLTSLPETTTAYDTVALVHATPAGDDPVGWTRGNAGVWPRDFEKVGASHLEDSRILLLGHTHEQHATEVTTARGEPGLVLNPGAVGYPLQDADDSTGRADFAVVDTESREYVLESVTYDSTAVLEFLQARGLD